MSDSAPPPEESSSPPSAVSAPQLPPTPLRGIPVPQVVFLGRAWRKAGTLEMVFWACCLLGALTTLFLATFVLRPDARGMGTHEQLGLPPCGFPELTGGVPCPSCGYTTTFTLAAHGRPLDAFLNQPFGFLVFLATLLSVPLTAGALIKRISLFGATDKWPWVAIIFAGIALWLLAWSYKWWSLTP